MDPNKIIEDLAEKWEISPDGIGKIPIYLSWRIMALSRKILNYKMHPQSKNAYVRIAKG